jgi:putative membrane protein
MRINLASLISVAIGGILASLYPTQWWMVFIGLLIALVPVFYTIYSINNNTALKFISLGLVLAGLEWVAVKTGFPYGQFEYTSLMQPQLFDLPVLMVLIWPTIILGIWYVVKKIMARHEIKNWVVEMVLLMLLVVGFDLVMDPGSVQMGLWSWGSINGAWFGVPYTNFIGWAVFGLVGWITLRTINVSTSENYLYSVILLTTFWTGYIAMQAWVVPVVLGLLLIGLFLSTTDRVEAQIIGQATKI